ncbi:diphosphomevalonate/mevalonate 3,5-bisphosphate decarboxylase family protein [Ancylomarina longa]|uniref:Diphosphomevalonate decarboxylase n=1 Tax=Ancylomarina longa TaxID=2487017 RepID=A0A434AUI2_9BACT|nr:diphosphomevalonate decarboxylase [Ancylomarina longa]RUT78003.1 diphosphomevalonate decarboxylase [Ancylomarina longa]
MNNDNQRGSVCWESPSNIALIKYWGKKGNQLPCNPSLSMSLKHAVTHTQLDYVPKKTEKKIHFKFDGKTQPTFEKRIAEFIDSLVNHLPFISDFEFDISSKNTFPHSAGIASSASAMSALALCLCSAEENITGKKLEEREYLQKASFIARLGSGSASRSIYGGYAAWGETNAFSKASNNYAVPFSQYTHPVFHDYQDTILLISAKQKLVSSTAGHQLMNNHPYANARYSQAFSNFERLLGILRGGDLIDFAKIVENEALSLHALMMNSSPSFTLLKPNTLEAIERIKQFRTDTKTPICFTLDAGPNIHLLFPKSEKEVIASFVDSELKNLLEDGKYLLDEVGEGPQKIIIE